MKNYTGAIFDIDGTILDSMQKWENVEVEYLLSLGIKPKPGLHKDLRELGGNEIPLYFQREYGISKTAEEMHIAVNKLLEDFYHNEAILKAGAVRVLDMLRENGVKLCAATATDRHLIEPALKRCGAFDYFSRIFTCKEENTSKKRPDIFLRAAAFLGTDIKDTLVFEDAVYAIRTACAAGFPVVAVYDLASDDQQDEIKKLCSIYCKSLVSFPDYC